MNRSAVFEGAAFGVCYGVIVISVAPLESIKKGVLSAVARE